MSRNLAPAATPDNLSLIPATHVVRREPVSESCCGLCLAMPSLRPRFKADCLSPNLSAWSFHAINSPAQMDRGPRGFAHVVTILKLNTGSSCFLLTDLAILAICPRYFISQNPEKMLLNLSQTPLWPFWGGSLIGEVDCSRYEGN